MSSKTVMYKEQELLFYYKCFSTFFSCDTAQHSRSCLFLFPSQIHCNSSLILTEAQKKSM